MNESSFDEDLRKDMECIGNWMRNNEQNFINWCEGKEEQKAMTNKSIKPITPPPEGKGGIWKGYKNRRTRLINKLKSISGVNEELLGPHEPELNWISTKDRLPEAGEWIIYSTGTPLFTYVGRYCNEADPMPSLPNWLKWEQVKHWMPLPEPPKEINQ